MKKVLIYLIIFTVLCAVSSYGVDYLVFHKIENISPYYLSFSSIGAISLESRVDCWAKINTSLSVNELSQNLKNIIDCLGLSVIDNEITTESTNNGYVLGYQCESGKLIYSVKAETELNENESYLLLTIISNNPEPVDLTIVEEQLKSSRYKWKYYYLYTGKLDYCVDSDSRREMLKVILDNLAADSLEIYEDEYMTSMTGYTSLFKNSVTIQGNKYNVQTAIRNSQDKETLVYIGQPLILGDY